MTPPDKASEASDDDETQEPETLAEKALRLIVRSQQLRQRSRKLRETPKLEKDDSGHASQE